MAGVTRIIQEQIEEAENIALAAAAILAELRPLAQAALARNDQYSIERLRRIAQAAEGIRQRGIARRPSEHRRPHGSASFHCTSLEFQHD